MWGQGNQRYPDGNQGYPNNDQGYPPPQGFLDQGGFAHSPGQPGYNPGYGPPPGQPMQSGLTECYAYTNDIHSFPPGPPPSNRAFPQISQIPGLGKIPGVKHLQRFLPRQGNDYPGLHGGPPPQGQYAPSSSYPPQDQADTPSPHMPPTQQQYYGPTFETADHQQEQPWFQYSQCTGKKKALCIGINYHGQEVGELQGCINDARNIADFLCTHFGYNQDDIVMLTDDSPDPNALPTRDNIIQAMQWLASDAQEDDSLFFHYSGHGGQTKDHDGDEMDGCDEVIYPVDAETAGDIVDDDLHEIMVKPLPPGCRLTCIFDSCHSGSVLDLPYIYSTEGKIKEPNLALEAGQGLLSAARSYRKGDMGGVFKSVTGLIRTASGNTQKASEYAKATKTSAADIISWSGCKDSQTSADVQEPGNATGAMSFAFMSALGVDTNQTYQQLLVNIRDILHSGGYDQKPQLSSSHPMDTSILFIC